MSDTTKATPGPWQSHCMTYRSAPNHVLLWPDKGGQHMRRLDESGAFKEADARLIASAPDLLAALIRLLACHTESAGMTMSMVADKEAFHAFMEQCESNVTAAVESARAAIAKVGGAA